MRAATAAMKRSVRRRLWAKLNTASRHLSSTVALFGGSSVRPSRLWSYLTYKNLICTHLAVTGEER